MVLSDRGIKQRLNDGSLIISPLKMEQIQPASVDINLSNRFMYVDELTQSKLSIYEEAIYREITSDTIIIQANSFILAVTEQIIELPNDLTVFVEGRSSIGRMGVFIQNAGWVDPGYKGRITLELFNAGRLPVELIAGQKICQYVISQLDQPAENPYKGKYQNSQDVIGSKIFQEFKRQ